MLGTNTYINGSDLLLLVGTHALGHCTSHTVTFNSETKERAVKPAADLASSNSLFKRKSVTGLSVSVNGEGLRFYDEDEHGFNYLMKIWAAGQPVALKAFPRGSDVASPGTMDAYMKGNFVITSLEETSPAQDDATYKVTFENDGPVDIDEDVVNTGDMTDGSRNYSGSSSSGSSSS